MKDHLLTEAPVDFSALSSAVSKFEREGSLHCDSLKIVFLRNITVEGVDVFLKYYLYKENVRPEIAFGGYGTMVQDILAPDSLVRKTDPDLIVVSLALDELDPRFGTPGWRADDACLMLERLYDLLQSKSRAIISVNNFIPPLYPEQGIALASDHSDITAQVVKLNQYIADFVRSRPARFCLNDWNCYIARLGAESSLDARGRYLWKAPFKKSFLNVYGHDLSRIGRMLKGKAKKCLVLDCDNTLWGGIIGEDGIEGIKLDRNTYPGKAFYDFQNDLLHLANRGVLIVLCSKNNEADVFEVLDNHPWCVLKRSHLAGWRVNWKNKAENLAELARDLNLSHDSFVFMDDSPVECGLIREMLPDVTVLQIPEKLYELPSLVFQQGLFDGFQSTDEDKQRARLYQNEAQRKSSIGSFTNIEEYLFSLQTVASIHRIREQEFIRTSQLTQKTNQFNLTTHRYTERDIRIFAERPDAAVFTMSVRDRFGDLGLIGVLILERDGATGKIDTFLMSCRVLGRGLEYAMVTHCLQEMELIWEVENWHAEYIPTRKNMQVSDFWPANHFALTNAGADGKKYTRNAGGASVPILSYISIRED